MNDIVDDLPEGFIEVEPQLLLELAVYALKDLVVAATIWLLLNIAVLD